VTFEPSLSGLQRGASGRATLVDEAIDVGHGRSDPLVTHDNGFAWSCSR